MSDKLTAIDVLRRIEDGTFGWSDCGPATLAALQLAACHDHPRWSEYTDPYDRHFRGSIDELFAALFPDEVTP